MFSYLMKLLFPNFKQYIGLLDSDFDSIFWYVKAWWWFGSKLFVHWMIVVSAGQMALYNKLPVSTDRVLSYIV